jgi:hypothetical protein
MSYGSTTDFLALLRQTLHGERVVQMPGLDYLVAALARAGVFALSIGQSAPVVNQVTTAWFRPAVPSWASEGVLFLWNSITVEYEPATPALWSALFLHTAIFSETVQDVTVAGPTAVQTGADVVRVQNVGAPVALTVGLSINASRAVLVTDWANHAGTNPITLTLSGGDIFPGGGNTWVIGADAGSIFLRPVPGGYAL